MIIVIDPGHAKKQNNANGYYESEGNWRRAQEVVKVLRERGATVYLTKNSLDEDPSLTERGKFAAEKRADVFISLHSDASNKPATRGVHTIRSISRPGSAELGLALAKAISAAIGIPVRSFSPVWYRESETRKGKNFDYYTVLDWASNYERMGGTNGKGVANSFLIEIGYHTNLEDVARLKNGAYDNAVGHAIADAVGLARPQVDTGEIYRVQTGAFTYLSNANALAAKLKKDGFDTYLIEADGYYKVQVGAFSVKSNAGAMEKKLKGLGYATFITTKAGKPANIAETVEVPKTIKVGSQVRVVRGARSYTNEKLASFVYDTTYTVLGIRRDKYTIGIGTTITAVMRVTDLIFVK